MSLADSHPMLFMFFSSCCRETRWEAVREGGCTCPPGICTMRDGDRKPFYEEALKLKAVALARVPTQLVPIHYFTKKRK